MKAPLEPAAIAAAIQESLRRRKPPRLGPLVKSWRYRSSSDDMLPPLAPETARFLVRFGVLDAGTEPAQQQKAFQSWLRSASRRTGDAPGVLAAWLQLFAAGEYGVVDGICEQQPRCGECALKESCRYLLAGASDARTFGADLAKSLARGESEALRPSDLLAFLLSGEKSGAGTIARTEVLLKESGGLRGALEAACDAASPALAAFSEPERARLNALSQLTRLWAAERNSPGQVFRNGQDFFELYHLRLREMKQEVFIVAMLDQKNRLIADEQVSLGTLSETLVHPREVFSQAIARRAAAIAVIHNHPSGDPTPSPADKSITRRLDSVARTVGIRLLDHIIIGDGRYVSFVDENLLQS